MMNQLRSADIFCNSTFSSDQEAKDGGRARGAQGREVLGEADKEQGGHEEEQRGQKAEAEPDRPEGRPPREGEQVLAGPD